MMILNWEHLILQIHLLLTITLRALAKRNKRNARYRGNMQVGEVLIGMTSGARAVVQRRRHMTDRNGWYRGNFFIPPPVKNVNPHVGELVSEPENDFSV